MTEREVVSLREYIDLRFDENHRAIEKSEKMLNDRLAGMNEFRETLKDQASRFITRDELALMMKPTCDKVDGLIRVNDQATGKASARSVLWTAVAALAGLVIGILNLIHVLTGG